MQSQSMRDIFSIFPPSTQQCFRDEFAKAGVDFKQWFDNEVDSVFKVELMDGLSACIQG